jgi:hypothetical protein
MGHYYLRGSKASDSSYAIFSTNTDSFEWFFTTRDDMISHMKEEIRFQHPYWGDDGHMHIPDEIPRFMVSVVREQLYRLDTYGSTHLLRLGNYDRGYIRVLHGVPRRKPRCDWALPRDQADAYIKAHLVNDPKTANALLVAQPWED